MNKPIARLVTRLQGEGDGLIIGALLQSGQGMLKPNHVYQMEECILSGEIVLKDKGESVIAKENQPYTESPVGQTWGSEIGYLLSTLNSYLFLTREEHQTVTKDLEKQRNEY